MVFPENEIVCKICKSSIQLSCREPVKVFCFFCLSNVDIRFCVYLITGEKWLDLLGIRLVCVVYEVFCVTGWTCLLLCSSFGKFVWERICQSIVIKNSSKINPQVSASPACIIIFYPWTATDQVAKPSPSPRAALASRNRHFVFKRTRKLFFWHLPTFWCSKNSQALLLFLAETSLGCLVGNRYVKFNYLRKFGQEYVVKNRAYCLKESMNQNLYTN